MTSLPLSIWLIGSLPIFPSCSFSELQVPCWILLFKKLSSICLLFRWFLKNFLIQVLSWFPSFAPLRMGAFCVVVGPFNKSHIAGPFSSPLWFLWVSLCVLLSVRMDVSPVSLFLFLFFVLCDAFLKNYLHLSPRSALLLWGDCLHWHSLRSDSECLCTAGQVCLFIFLISGCLFTQC